MELVHVPDGKIPAAVLCEKAEFGLVRDALTVSQMVVGRGDEAVLRQELHESVVAGCVLRYAVGYLYRSPDLTVRVPSADVYLGPAVC